MTLITLKLVCIRQYLRGEGGGQPTEEIPYKSNRKWNNLFKNVGVVQFPVTS